MKVMAQYPVGSAELLLRLQPYSFNRLLANEAADPWRVPAGTRMAARGAFDNQAQNRFNFNPDT